MAETPLPRKNPLESTAQLLDLVRRGDAPARERLAARYLKSLQSFAHGRMPAHARGVVDTDDLVQIAIIRALDHVETFRPDREGSFLAYLRTIVCNLVRDKARSARVPVVPLDGGEPSGARSVLEDLVESEDYRRYEAALAQLSALHQEAVLMRLELNATYGEIAEALGWSSSAAARMAVTRAVTRLALTMKKLAQEKSP